MGAGDLSIVRKVLLILLFVAAAAQAKSLRWKELAVTAHLDADGREGTPGNFTPTFIGVNVVNGGAAPPFTVDSL